MNRSDGRVGKWTRQGILPVLSVVLGMFAASSHAEQIVVEPVISTMHCLETPAPDKLVLPNDASVKIGALLRLRISFPSRDGPPKVVVFFDSAGSDFRRAVLDYVDGYRLPCLEASMAPAVATQEFVYRPEAGGKVVSGAVRAVAENPASSCFTGTGAFLSYPRSSHRSNDPGKDDRVVVLGEMVFTAANEPPKVSIVFNSGDQAFADAVEAHVSHYRFSCKVDSPSGYRVRQQFTFAMEGTPELAFKDTALQDMVRALSKLDEQKVRFDFTTMDCPFKVQLSYWRPYADNGVSDVGVVNANRQEFAQWLKKIEFKGSTATLRQLVGKNLTVLVPCGLLDLT